MTESNAFDHECASDETVIMFIAGQFDRQTRQRLVAHIARCGACRERILSARIAPRCNPAVRAERRALIAVIVLASALIVVLLFIAIFRWQSPPKGVAALVKACDGLPYRAVEGRVSGGFGYKPMRPRLRGRSSNEAAFLGLEAVALSAESDRSDMSTAGTGALLAQDYSEAIALYESVLQKHPNDVTTLNNLSAAYHERALANSHAPDHMAALDAADRAWRLARTPEIAWNRALALSALSLRGPAERAWNDFLAFDDRSGWRSEAIRRLHVLRSPTQQELWQRAVVHFESWNAWPDSMRADDARRFPAELLAYFDQTSVPQWAMAQLRHDRNADQLRAHAQAIAELLRWPNDLFAVDAIRTIEIACQRLDDCNALAAAHDTYARGVKLLDAQGTVAAGAAFDEASRIFARFHSPYEVSAQFLRATCMVHANQFTQAAATGKAIFATIEKRGYRTLRGRTEWLLGLTALHQAHPEESIEHYRAARELFLAGRDTTNAASMELLLADAFEFVGDRDVAMEHRLAGFAAMHKDGDTKQLSLALFEAGTSANGYGWTAAADLLLAEAAREAIGAKRFVIASLAYMWRSSIAVRTHDFRAASEQAKLATFYTHQTSDPGQRALLDANAGELSASSNEISAIARLSETIRFFEQAGNRAWLPELFHQRALLQERDGQRAAAEADLETAINIAEQVLDREAPATMRDGFGAEFRSTYEDMIRLLLARGATGDALAIAERARLIGTGPHTNDDVRRAADSIAPDVVVSILELQNSTIVVWLVENGSIRTIQFDADPAAVSRMKTGEFDWSSESSRRDVYDLLMRGWVSSVRPSSRLVISPPPVLARVPFGALVDRRDGRAVIESHVVTIAANLSSVRNATPPVSTTDPVLIVGDPAYRTASRLPASRDEAFEVAAHYRHPEILVGSDATAARVAARLGRATIFHFGGHAVANAIAPELSHLLLASDGHVDTRLYVHELLNRELPLKLVVLAGCSTANAANRQQGNLTVARAFLDGGAQAVVGTNWAVSDEAAAAFSRLLHSALTRGEDVATASRFAQLQLRSMAPGDPTWAAFCVFQGNSIRKE